MEKKTEQTEKMDTIRINKYLSDAGICSRREADRMTEAGRITVNGQVVKTGERINADALVCVDGKPIKKEEKRVLLLFYKPRGIVCSTKKQKEETTVTEFLKYPIRVYPVGRLDKESEGLLLMTNQGDLVNRIMRAGNYHEKEYLVTVDREIDERFLKGMSEGVPILDTLTRPCFVERTGKKSFRIILTQGLNRQIRRMCEYFGYHVTSLKRIRIMNLTTEGLAEGCCREIRPDEWKELNRRIQKSSSETVTDRGGKNGNIPAGNESAGRKAERGSKGLLSGREGNHKQPGVRCSVRPASGNGKKYRDRTGKQSDRKRRI